MAVKKMMFNISKGECWMAAHSTPCQRMFLLFILILPITPNDRPCSPCVTSVMSVLRDNENQRFAWGLDTTEETIIAAAFAPEINPNASSLACNQTIDIVQSSRQLYRWAQLSSVLYITVDKTSLFKNEEPDQFDIFKVRHKN